MSAARERLMAFTRRQSDDMLITAMLDLYGRPRTHPDAQAHMIAARAQVDVLAERYPATEQWLEGWFADESDAGITFICGHTYGELMALAVSLVKEGKEAPAVTYG